MKRSTAVNLIAAGMILLLLYTALSKLLDFAVFRFQLGLSPLLAPVAGIVAWAVPVVEILIAVFLLVRPTKLWGLYAAAGLMFLFTGYVVVMLTAYSNLPCTCGGLVAKLSWPAHLALNVFFTICAVIGIILERKNKQASMSLYTPS